MAGVSTYVPGYPKEDSANPLYVEGTSPIALEANSYNIVFQVDLGNTVEVDLPLLGDVPNLNAFKVYSSYSGTINLVRSGSDEIKEGVSVTTSVSCANGVPLTVQKLFDNGAQTYYWTVTARDDPGVITKYNSGSGVATLNGSGVATVANLKVTASSLFSLTVQDTGSAPTGGLIYVSGRSNGVSFTITSTSGSGDSGVKVFYQIWESRVF